MAIPKINIYSVDRENIFLNWKVTTPDVIQSFNLYSSAAYGGPYTKIMTGVANYHNDITPGSVLVKIVRSQYSIGADQPFFFKITSVNAAGTESDITLSNFVSVDPFDVYKERMDDAFNPVYKNIKLTVLAGATEEFVDIERILDRDVNFVQIRTDQPIKIRWNSQYNDPISIAASSAAAPFTQFDKQSILIKSAYIDNPGADAHVEIFVSGN